MRAALVLLACCSADASRAIPDYACSLAAAPKKEVVPSGSVPVDQKFLAGEMADAKAVATNAMKFDTLATDSKTPPKLAAEYDADAVNLMKDAAKEGQDAAKLTAAVMKEGAQKVTAVDGTALSKLVAEKKDLLVVFYAPWCGHCKNFVMADDAGNPNKAPLELLNKDFEAAKGPKIVKFNIDAGGAIPADFDVQFIPTVYMVSSGTYKKFAGNPHDVPALKTFAGVKAAMLQSRVAVKKGIPQTGWANGKKPHEDKMPVDVGDRVTDPLGRILPTHMDGLTHTGDWGSEYGPMKPANTISMNGGAPKSGAAAVSAAFAVVAASAVQILL